MSPATPRTPGSPSTDVEPVGSPIPPRNDRADSDSSAQRKRPRLDDGEQDHRSIAADSPVALGSPRTPPQSISKPAELLNGTPSRVTINVRPPVSDASPTGASGQADKTITAVKVQATPASPVELVSNGSAVDGESDGSPALSSPRIEAAEPEDIVAARSPVAMDPMSETELVRMCMYHFPFVENDECPGDTLGRIRDHLVQDETGKSPPVFREVVGWMQQYLKVSERLPDKWFDLYTDYREFWDAMPVFVGSVVAKSPVSRYLQRQERGLSADQEHATDLVVQFLQAYARLTARMVLVDIRTLHANRSETSAQPDLLSMGYLKQFSLIVLNENALLLKPLGTNASSSILHNCLDSFLSQLPQSLTTLMDYTLELLDRPVIEEEALMSCSETVGACISDWFRRIDQAVSSATALHNARPMLAEYFETVNERVQKLVRQQSSSLRLENLRSIHRSLTYLLSDSISKLSVPFTSRLPKDYAPEADKTDLSYRAFLITTSWKMMVCKECIMRGHMDARVFGVSEMNEILLNAYNRYYKDNPPGEPLDSTLQFLVDFIHQHKIIHYLIGIGSHRQLVSRTKNIVIFLGATKQYTDSVTDTIWDAIRTGQDPRVVESIVDLVKELLSWCSRMQLVHYFNKFLELPTSSFNARMRDLCHSVVNVLISSKNPDPVPAGFSMKLYALFVRLLQEVYADSEVPFVEKRELIGFAQAQLSALIDARLPDVDRLAIVSDCLNEMSSASSKACGSAVAICMILGPEFGHDTLPQLQEDFDFARKVIEDTARLKEIEEQLQINLADHRETVIDRLSLVVKIIVLTPSALTEELVQKMWTSLVDEQALHDYFRDAAWSLLGRAISNSGPDQRTLVDLILHKHLPNLEASFLTPNILEFADRIAEYEIRMAKTEEDVTPASPLLCVDLFRSIALKALHAETATAAIDRLVYHQLHATGALDLQSHNEMPGVHAAFIDRAVQDLISAANEYRHLQSGASLGHDDLMTTSSQNPSIVQAKHRVEISLTILRKFVEQARAKAAASPRADSVKSYGASSMPGDPVKICFEAHAAGKSSQRATFEIGDLSTVKDLVRILSAKTGFNKLNIIVGGQRINVSKEAETRLREMPTGIHGLLLVQKLPSDNAETAVFSNKHVSPWDREVLKHFHAIYDLLDLGLEISRGIYRFLSTFLPHEDVVAEVCNLAPANNYSLPISSTFKCLYCIHALRVHLAQAQQEGLSCSDLVAHGVQLISSAIISLDTTSDGTCSQEDLVVLKGLVPTLVKLLKEPVSEDVSARYFEQPEELVDHLTSFITSSFGQDSPPDFALAECCFAAILDITLHSQHLREYVTSRPSHASLIKIMLLESRYVKIRDAAKRALEAFLVALRGLPNEEMDRVYVFLWASLYSWIPEACEVPQLSEQFFTLAVGVFRNLSNGVRATLPLHEYGMQWMSLLSEHRHYEFVGRTTTNFAVLGLASLLRDCMAKGEAQSLSVQLSGEMLEKLFGNLLFPDVNRDVKVSAANGRVPILDPKTRSRLYTVLVGGSVDVPMLRKLVGLCGHLFDVNPASPAWTWGLAQPSPETGYTEPNRAFDGTHAIRSSTGYPGLRNLSNTCYMNSLLTQLFMNRDFRSFVLGLDVANSPGSLVYEIQRIFVYLQESCLHAIDPEYVAEAVITYDKTPIDINIQMDVDEFYNLLFDRLESQMPSTKTKWKLRQFYGGSIVQQIKSKDCPHISERTEPFQAIQCEIIGKSTLEESLKAYVEGEIMEGDNKYSCSSCGSYVNAVKRACLKDVPDNLIFHLKRFDYDLATGMRSKINDYFQFPPEVDLGPFKIDYLKDTSIPAEPDLFTLVGVLVHTGQAESGHYYSYIRDGPSGTDAWLEFNDSEVTYFDSKAMQNSSFGGLLDGFDHEPLLKPWNAYMLFYRRKESQKQNDLPMPYSRHSLELTNQIRLDNELFLRKYAMFDDEHGFFVTSLLEKYVSLKTNAACSDGHHQEDEMIHFAMLYMDEVFSRQKDSRHALPVLQALGRIIEGCGDCAQILLRWFSAHPEGFHNLLVKCPMENERRALIDLVQTALNCIRDFGRSIDQIHVSGDGKESADFDPVALLCKTLAGLLPTIWQHHRAWDDFFGLLSDLAERGSYERGQLRSFGVLRYVLQVLAVTASRACARQWTQFQNLLKVMDRRHFSLRKLIVLAERLLREAELISETSSSGDDSPTSKAAVGLDVDDLHVLSLGTTSNSNSPLAVLEAVFFNTSAEPALAEKFVATLLHTTIGELHVVQIVAAILVGSRIEPPSNADPWLYGAVGFIENSDELRYIQYIVGMFADDVRTLEDSGGSVYLHFFERVRRAHNPILMAQNPVVFKTLSLHAVPKFGAGFLLHRRVDVRNRTHELIHVLLRECRGLDDDEIALQAQKCALDLCENCVRLIETYEAKRVPLDVTRIDKMQQMLRFFIADEAADLEDESVAERLLRVQAALDTLEAIATSSPQEVISDDDPESDSAVTEYS